MTWHDHDTARGFDDLRAAVLAVLGLRPESLVQPAGVPDWVLLSEARVQSGVGGSGDGGDGDRGDVASGTPTRRPRRRTPRPTAPA